MISNPSRVLMPLRVGQLASAVIVASLITQCWQYAYAWGGMSYTPIYTLTIAALSLFLALLCLTPFSRAFRSYTDYILSVLWIIAFGQLLGFRDYCSFTTGPASCSRRWKAATAFSFISSLLWLATAVYEIWYMRRFLSTEPLAADVADADPGVRQKWYQRSKV